MLRSDKFEGINLIFSLFSIRTRDLKERLMLPMAACDVITESSVVIPLHGSSYTVHVLVVCLNFRQSHHYVAH